MFIQNQISHLDNHKSVITAEIERSNEILLVVAYVRENGVDLILENIKGRSTKLLCSLDMGITQLSAIKKLLENDVKVKVYKSNEGTFHPKIWLFGRDNNQWKMLIGSANLTRAAFVDNVEASVLVEDHTATSNALLFFNYLWGSKNSSHLTIDEVNSLQNKIEERKTFRSQSNQSQEINDNDNQKTSVLFEYIKNWMDIPKYKSHGISSLWRGWYVIPDQGYIDDIKITHLKSYLPFIDPCVDQSDERFEQLLNKFVENSDFQGTNLITSPRYLFVRQAKNYLIKLGWCYHPIKRNGKPDKKILCLTDLGAQINQCEDLARVRFLYTEYFLNYSFNGLLIVRFTQNLLLKLEYLELEEFDYFVTHAYNDDDLNIIVNLINIYRSLSDTADFKQSVRSYFEEQKGGTANNVYGNYLKSIKHTISVIGWCDGFSMDSDFTLKLEHGNV